MTHTTGTLTAADGLKLFTQTWLPAGDPKAAVVIIHGLAEHSGRYQHVAAFLAERGYAVHAMDLRGHGQSEGRRSYVDHYEIHLSDLYAYFETVRAAQAAGRHFILGHSLGAALGLVFAGRYQYELDGLVLSGAAINLGASIPAFLKSIAEVVVALAPWLPVLKLPVATISKVPAVRQSYDTDPLNCRGRIRARMGMEVLNLAEAARQAATLITIPALVLHGGADRLVDPSSLDDVYRLLASPDKTKRLYEGLYHEIFNEPEKEQVLSDVVAWLEAHL